MARVVRLKLVFMKWFFYNLVMVIKLYKIRYLSLDKAYFFWETMLFVWKVEKLQWAPTATKLIFFAEIMQTFPTQQCLQKGVRNFFILFRSWVINKNVKTRVQKPDLFFIFAKNSRPKQNKKNLKHSFVENGT